MKQQEIEESSGHRRKRKSQGQKDSAPESEVKSEKDKQSASEKEKDDKPKPKRKPLPPPIDFMQLLQIAEKKQHEPIVLEVKPKPTKVEEPERLMTKKQMREHLKEKEWRERKEQRERGIPIGKSSNPPIESVKGNKPTTGLKIPKLNGAKTTSVQNSSGVEKSSGSKPQTIGASSIPKKPPIVSERNGNASNKPSEKDLLIEERKKLEAKKKMLEEMRRSIEEDEKKLALSRVKKAEDKPVAKSNGKMKIPESKLSVNDSKLRQALKQSDAKPQKLPPPADIKPRQFPPPDVRPARPKQFPPKDVKRKPILKKRKT